VKKITDKSIRGDILVRLSQEPGLRGIEFYVVVNDGEALLAGPVKTEAQKNAAERIAVGVPGVKRVVSYLEITSGAGGY